MKILGNSRMIISQILQKVDIHIKGEEYEGKLPQEAVKTGFNSKERILAKILSNNLGVKIISVCTGTNLYCRQNML